MRTLLLFLAILQTPSPTTPKAAGDPPNDPFAPLSVYNGSWTIHAVHPWGGGPAGSADHLVSHCTRYTAFFTCEQIVNARPAALIIYVPAEQPGKYYTRVVSPAGLAGVRGEMLITPSHPDHWTYTEKGTTADKTTYSRTENYFNGSNSIHFEEYVSNDNQSWTMTNEGDEIRLPH